MKIKSLDIYGYGKIIDQSFKIEHDFVQIYGENEAGKSTMMSFIHSVLLDFLVETKANHDANRDSVMHMVVA